MKQKTLEALALWILIAATMWIAVGISAIGVYCLVWIFLKALYAFGALWGVIALLSSLILPISILLTWFVLSSRAKAEKMAEKRAAATHSFSVSSLN